MGKLLESLNATLLIGLVLAILIAVFPHSGYANSVGANNLWLGIFQWLHVFFGITWIGLLYYFNFVQIPTMPKVPAELKPGVTKYIAPAALFWFRYSALLTVILFELGDFPMMRKLLLGIKSRAEETAAPLPASSSASRRSGSSSSGVLT